MKKHLLFIFSTLLCLPFVAVLVVYLFTFVIGIPDVVIRPLLFIAMWVSSRPVVVLIIVGCVTICVAIAWFQKSKSRFEVASLYVYTIVMLFCFGLTLWIWLTGWKMAVG